MEFWGFFCRIVFRIEISFQICWQILSPEGVGSVKALRLFMACDGLVTKPKPTHHYLLSPNIFLVIVSYDSTILLTLLP